MTKYIINNLLCLSFIQQGCSVSMKDYPYEPQVVELKGILEQEQRFGPPTYGESPKIDKRLNIYVLNLKAPIIVGTNDTLSDLNDTLITDVDKVQVKFLDGAPPLNLLGKVVVLKGVLSKSIWGSDFYPVVFRVLYQTPTTVGYDLSRPAIAVQSFGHEAAHSMGIDINRGIAPTHYNAERVGLDAMKRFRRMYE